MSRPTVLIFDLDGTLVDSMPLLTQIFCDVLEEYADVRPELSRDVYLSLAGMGPESQFREVLRRVEAEGAAAHQLADVFWSRSEDLVAPPFPEVPGILDALAAQDYAMFVSSGGKPSFAQGRAKRAGIAGYFRLLLGTDEHDPAMAKGPPHFRIIAESLGIAASGLSTAAWMIGDGPYDMQVARAAGIRAIGRLTGDNAQQLRQAGADELIVDLIALRSILESHAS